MGEFAIKSFHDQEGHLFLQKKKKKKKKGGGIFKINHVNLWPNLFISSSYGISDDVNIKSTKTIMDLLLKVGLSRVESNVD